MCDLHSVMLVLYMNCIDRGVYSVAPRVLWECADWTVPRSYLVLDFIMFWNAVYACSFLPGCFNRELHFFPHDYITWSAIQGWTKYHTSLVKEVAFFPPEMYEMFMYVCKKMWLLDATNKLIFLWHHQIGLESFFWIMFGLWKFRAVVLSLLDSRVTRCSQKFYVIFPCFS